MNPLSIQIYLENATCDVLFLYDCCHSIHAGSGDTTTGVKEALAAGGFETIAAEVGEHSFTHLMTTELARAAEKGRSISVSDLHGYMLAGLGDYTPKLVKDNKGKLVFDCNKRPRFEPPRRRTPVHYFLSQKRESIVLGPRRPIPPDQYMPPPRRGSLELASEGNVDGPDSEFIEINAPQFPQVIVSVRLQSSDSSEARAWVDWLLKAPPEGQDIKVEGWFGSFSILVILNLPLQVWHTMPSNPAMSFVGFVTTENLASALLPNKPNILRWLETDATGSTQYASSIVADSAIELQSRPGQDFASRKQTKAIASQFGTPLVFRNRINMNATPDEDQNLSCPYRKRNRLRFNIRNYQSCAIQSFPDISQLK